MLSEGGGQAYSIGVAFRSHLTIDHASLSRRTTVPVPDRDTSNIWAFITFFPHVAYIDVLLTYLMPFLFRRLWPSIS